MKKKKDHECLAQSCSHQEKKPSPILWALSQTGSHKGEYIKSVLFAVIGVAFSLAPYFVIVEIVDGLMDGNRDFSFPRERATRRPLRFSERFENAARKSSFVCLSVPFRNKVPEP